MPPEQLREHAQLLYNTLGHSKIGVPVPISEIELLAWISTVQRLHLEPLRKKAALKAAKRPSGSFEGSKDPPQSPAAIHGNAHECVVEVPQVFQVDALVVEKPQQAP